MTALTRKQKRALERFAEFTISLDELRRELHGAVDFEFGEHERKLTSHCATPEPGIRVEFAHLQRAMDNHSAGSITTEELANWAAMLLLNDAYDWSGPEEDRISDLLHDLSELTLRHRPID